MHARWHVNFCAFTTILGKQKQDWSVMCSRALRLCEARKYLLEYQFCLFSLSHSDRLLSVSRCAPWSMDAEEFLGVCLIHHRSFVSPRTNIPWNYLFPFFLLPRCEVELSPTFMMPRLMSFIKSLSIPSSPTKLRLRRRRELYDMKKFSFLTFFTLNLFLVISDSRRGAKRIRATTWNMKRSKTSQQKKIDWFR